MENNNISENAASPAKLDKIKKIVIYILYAIAFLGYVLIRIYTRRQLFAVTFVFFMLGITGIYTFFSETKRRFPIFFGAIELGSIIIFVKLFYLVYIRFIYPYFIY